MPGRLAYLALAAVILAVWALMMQVSVPAITRAAGGQALFDFRLTGYDLATAQAFLGRLTPVGRDLYLEGQLRLDMILPPALAVFLAWSFVVLLPRPAAIAMALVAVAGCVADLFENMAIRQMLLAPELTDAIVAQASQATVAKWVFDGLALAVFAAALALALWRKLSRGGGWK